MPRVREGLLARDALAADRGAAAGSGGTGAPGRQSWAAPRAGSGAVAARRQRESLAGCGALAWRGRSSARRGYAAAEDERENAMNPGSHRVCLQDGATRRELLCVGGLSL